MDNECHVFENNGLLITAIGNPNMDKTVKLQSRELIDKFNIPLNGHMPVAGDLIKDIEEEITRCVTQAPT